MKDSIKIILLFILLSIGCYLLYYTLNKSNQKNSYNNSSNKTNEITFDDSQHHQSIETSLKHKIYSATSKDGLLWIKNAKILFDYATSPKAIYKDGLIYLYYVDTKDLKSNKIYVAISSDLGKSFTTKKIHIDTFEPLDIKEPDPVLIDDKIRLYFRGENLSEKTLANKEYKIFYSNSSDGINFDMPQLAYQSKIVSTHPDIYFYKNQLYMFLTNNNELNFASSSNQGLLFDFDSNFIFNHAKYSNTINQSGILRTYYCDTSIKSAIGAEDKKLIPEKGIRLSEEGKIACHPSVIKISDSQYLMFYTINH